MIRRKFITTVQMLVPVVMAAVLFLTYRTLTSSGLPADVRSRAEFPLYAPKPSQTVLIDKKSFSYQENGGEQLFSYRLTIQDQVGGQKVGVTISEQAYPEGLIYDKLAGTFREQRELGTALGTLTVGRPDGAPRDTAAVIGTGETLIFAKPSGALSDTQWRTLFNSLQKVD